MTIIAKPIQPSKLTTALANQEQPKSIESLIQASIKELGRALPESMSADKLARVALTCVRLNPDLAKATPESFLGSLFVLAQLGLQPGVAGQAYLIPFKNSRKINGEWKSFYEVTAVVGYRGLISMFYRSENALSIDVKTVYEGDFFEFEYGSGAYLKHRPKLGGKGKPIAYYSIAKMRGDASLFHVMSAEETLEHGKTHSKTYDAKAGKFYDSSPWAKEPESMCRKTVLIQLSKMLPTSTEFQKALSIDETSRNYRSDIESALDMPTTSWKTEESSSPANSGALDAELAQTPVQPEKEQPKPEPGSFDDFPGK